MAFWKQIDETYKIPYYPNVSMGWDPSPRADSVRYVWQLWIPVHADVSGNTPERFQAALEMAKQRLMSRRPVGGSSR